MKKNRRLQQLYAIARNMNEFPTEIRLRAVGITATEMQFRPLLHRIAEYIYVWILLILRQNVDSISIGISQISIRHYVTLEGITQYQAFISSMSAKENLKICCTLIQNANCETLEELCHVYNGNSTWFYRDALKRNYAVVRQMESRRTN